MDYTKAENILKFFNLDKVGPGWHFSAPYMCGDRLTIQFHDDFFGGLKFSITSMFTSRASRLLMMVMGRIVLLWISFVLF